MHGLMQAVLLHTVPTLSPHQRSCLPHLLHLAQPACQVLQTKSLCCNIQHIALRGTHQATMARHHVCRTAHGAQQSQPWLLLLLLQGCCWGWCVLLAWGCLRQEEPRRSLHQPWGCQLWNMLLVLRLLPLPW